ncbi:MAG: hypothetical protein JW839_19705 [Candidatus Lokiarchaeota archaeon]|nr:hypothetical protein [Candidatus Lokiarchaeota archaeon]
MFTNSNIRSLIPASFNTAWNTGWWVLGVQAAMTTRSSLFFSIAALMLLAPPSVQYER